MTGRSVSDEARALIELEKLSQFYHPRHAAQFAYGIGLREERLRVAQDKARSVN